MSSTWRFHILVALVAMSVWAVAVQRAQAQSLFRSGVDVVDFGVTVTDSDGDLVTDLTAEDFEVVEEGERQQISYFARGGVQTEFLPPLHIGLLFDTSGSMEGDLKLAKSGAIRFLNTLIDAVDITLVDFDTEVRVARYGQADFPRLVERIRMREPEGFTALYDALGVYLDGATTQDGRKILVVFSDGGDTRSALSLTDTLDLLKASDVTLYAIGFLGHQPRSWRMPLRTSLHRLAEVTGGKAFFPRSMDDLAEAYDEVVAEIEAQYSLGFVPAELRTDGSWRDVEIRLTRDDLKKSKIRARKGYFAPYLESGVDLAPGAAAQR